MSKLFGPVYAESYDALYRDKDYSAECDLIERVFRTHGNGEVHSVLDLGCGTGSHAVPLAERGYEVTGVDRSPDMLAYARAKAGSRSNSRNLTFEQADLRDLDLHRTFDSVLIMFAVLGYQPGNEDILSTLRNARAHLSVGGLLLFDVWYGPAVLAQRPSQRVKVIPTNSGQALRVSSGTLDIRHHLCRVDYLLWALEEDRLIGKAEESHLMRYFFPLELELYLQSSGFESIRLGCFPDFDHEPDETTWNVLQVAKAT